MDLYRKLHLISNSVDSSHFENNFKQMKNCPVTRNDMNEPCKQRTNCCYYYSATYVYSKNGEIIMRNSHLLLSN